MPAFFTAMPVVAQALIGGMAANVLGSAMADKEGGGGAASSPAPSVTKPAPMPVSPDLDPKKKQKAEQDILSAGLAGTAPLSREGTLLGGSGTLG